MARFQKFWKDFAKDPGPLMKAQSFPLALWQGISAKSRKDVWTRVAKQTDVESKKPGPTSNTLKEEVEASIEEELAASHRLGLAPPASQKQLPVIAAILLRHYAQLGTLSYSQGDAQLVATVLSVVEDEAVTGSLLYHFASRLAPYRAKGCAKLMTDVLVLADVLSSEIPTLVAHLNSSGVDVVDLSDIVRTWGLSLLASYFPRYAVLRLLDILLFEEAACLIAVVFGTLQVFHRAVISQKSEDVYAFLVNLPPSLTDTQTDDAWKVGYEVFRVGEKRMNALRKEKDWSKALQVPGVLTFEVGVGGRDVTKDKFAALGHMLEQKVPHAAHQDPEVTVQRAEDRSTQLPNLVFRIEKLKRQTGDSNMKKILEEAARELRRQHEDIQNLHIDLKHQEDRLIEAGLSAEASSAESSVSSMISDDDMVSSGTDLDVPRRRPPKERTPPKGTVLHSKLFQHQQFPCLYMEGYLLKARRKVGAANASSSAGFGNLHRRFFVLQGAFLTYFKSHRNSKPSRDLSVDMRGRRITQLEQHSFGKYGFEISEQGSSVCLYLLFASNDDERNVWAQVLQAATES